MYMDSGSVAEEEKERPSKRPRDRSRERDRDRDYYRGSDKDYARRDYYHNRDYEYRKSSRRNVPVRTSYSGSSSSSSRHRYHYRSRSRERSRSISYESRHKRGQSRSRRDRSISFESQTREPANVRIIQRDYNNHKQRNSRSKSPRRRNDHNQKEQLISSSSSSSNITNLNESISGGGGDGSSSKVLATTTTTTTTATNKINIDGEDFDKEKIHKEMQERLREHLAREGKVYPPPKPQAVHPIFANDGSFLETFKKLQEQHQQQRQHIIEYENAFEAATAVSRKPLPIASKRRGGKILKTGIVQKPKINTEENGGDTLNPKDPWAIYLQEVKKYKNVSCDADSKTRPLMSVKMTEADIKTAPFDPRFPNQNQTRYCYQSFIDFHRCQKARGVDYEPCQYFKRTYQSMCPKAWVEKWNDQLEAGTFPGNI